VSEPTAFRVRPALLEHQTARPARPALQLGRRLPVAYLTPAVPRPAVPPPVVRRLVVPRLVVSLLPTEARRLVRHRVGQAHRRQVPRRARASAVEADTG